MDKKSGKPIALILLMTIVMGLVFVLHADPAQTLIGMLLGVFLIVVLVNGGKRRILLQRLGPAIKQEVEQGKPYVVDLPTSVISLIKEGRKIEAVKVVRNVTGEGLFDAKNRIDEIHLRLELGQSIQCRQE